ncbi:hypothetical protein TWF225_003095 [Orbilia oligospora]|nr:hypothetical protein TWF225_003095 [Orbilia oligospora]KAF3244542.1 hypothetical protein TWF128_009654 [Orbilia oligospora]KAF3264933.1 hypothetical protein TWF217_003086 [Orbilia oligospora]
MAKDLPFKLSQTLVGHNEDVKDVLFVDPATIISCSRDATVRIWSPLVVGEDNKDKTDPPQTSETAAEDDAPNPLSITTSTFVDTINSNAQGFVNCLAYMKPDADHPKGLIISAGQESLIDVRPPGYLGPDAAYLLIGHSGNVCSLDVHGTTIISGSWDKTAIVWQNWEKKYVLEGHTAAVWAVMAVSDTEFITGCADGKIRWYRENQLYRSVQAHTQPVRGIHKLNDEKDGAFISCGNDGIIKSWSAEGREIETVYAHNAYIYSVTVLPNGEWASCGEDRTLKVWRKAQCLQSISHPCISVWCVSASPNGDLITGASDGVLRVWSREPERQADEETLKAYSEAIANLTIAEDTMDIDKASLPGMSALGRPGKHNGEKIHINNDGNIEAYQWSSSETTWEQVGVVASAVSSGRKVEYEGQFYDYVFDVDFEEGQPPKKLPFNASQNPWDAARIFLERNELPMSYLDTTANFIVQNTRGTQIGTSQQPQLPASADPFGIENRYRPGDELNQPPPPPPEPPKVLPWKTYLDIANVNLEAATKKILEHNAHFLALGQKEKSLNDEDLETLKALTGFLAKPSAPTSASAKGSAAVKNGLALLNKIITEWEGVRNLAALDLLRTLARYSPAVVLQDEDLFDLLDATRCLDSASPSHVTFGSRVLVNLFHHAEGLEYVTGSRAVDIMERIGTAVDGSKNRLALISADTLSLNFAVYYSKQKDTTSEQRSICLLQLLLRRIDLFSDTEALYRAMMALGTLMATGKRVFWAKVHDFEARRTIDDALKKIDKEKEKRIVDVVAEIDVLYANHPK